MVQFDPGNGLLAIGTSMKMRGLMFAIIPHRAHVNLQLADGVDLPVVHEPPPVLRIL